MTLSDLRVGSLARAVRHRLGWTQSKLGDRIGVSQSMISLLERGHLDRISVRTVRRIGGVLEIDLPFAPRWRGGDGVRLLDAHHASVVNQVVAAFRRAGWEVIVEYSFNHYDERGSVDVIAWHQHLRSLAIVEVKARLLDSQDTLATLDRKVRIVPRLLAAERGWRADRAGILLVLDELTANRSVVNRHAATFGAALPQRSVAVRRWIQNPGVPLAGIWFLRANDGVSGVRRVGTKRRVRPGRHEGASPADSRDSDQVAAAQGRRT